ncbi:MAG: hypothetical protein SFY67_10295 [Candidatus Melainabacteria bacterium]|nr:hypothetical protein [Candidatus Melainabacteria bacterium]
MPDIPLHNLNWIEPHWIDYGEYGKYCYIQSDCYFLDNLIHLCPNLLRGKWAVLTSFDSRPLVSPGTMPDWEYNIPTQVKTSYDLPLAGEGDEMYFFDRKVKVDELQSLTKVHDLGVKRLSEAGESLFESSWKQLEYVDVCSYISNQNLYTFIMKDKELAREFQQTGFYKSVATLHLVEMESWTQARLGLESVSEKCAQEGCEEYRVKFGANCPRHHFRMLTGHDLEE